MVKSYAGTQTSIPHMMLNEYMKTVHADSLVQPCLRALTTLSTLYPSVAAARLFCPVDSGGLTLHLDLQCHNA